MIDFMKKENAKRVAAGTHNFLGNSDYGFHTIPMEKHRQIARNGGLKTSKLHGSPFSRLTSEQRKEFGSRGGKATAHIPKTWLLEKLTCPHCGFVGQIAGAKRWHFDNCKRKAS